MLHGFDLEKFRPPVLVIEDNSGGVDNRVGEYGSAFDNEERLRCGQNVFVPKAMIAVCSAWRHATKFLLKTNET